MMKNVLKCFIGLSILVTLTSCFKNSDKTQPNEDIYGSFFYNYEQKNIDLDWRLTKESFYNQIDSYEKEDRFLLEAEIIYSFGEGTEFVDGKETMVLTFPKKNFPFANDIPWINGFYFSDEFDTNFQKIFEKCDFLVQGNCNAERNSVYLNDGTLLMRQGCFTVPYSFKNNIASAMDCFETYNLFYPEQYQIDEAEYFTGIYVKNPSEEIIQEINFHKKAFVKYEDFLKTIRNKNEKTTEDISYE